MKKIIIILIAFMLALVAGIYYWQNKSGNPLSEYTESYTHPIYNFSFNYPKGFTVTSIPNGGVETILVQNITTRVAVQITISPLKDNDIDITPDIIKTDIPDIKIDNAQEIPVGPSRKGLAFISDNSAFGGKSSEAWFAFEENLYQISTYYEFDNFLKGIFATWKFE